MYSRTIATAFNYMYNFQWMINTFLDATMTKPKAKKGVGPGSGRSRSAKKKKTAPVPYHAKRWIRRKSKKLRPGTLRTL
jgi:hypothetical protein